MLEVLVRVNTAAAEAAVARLASLQSGMASISGHMAVVGNNAVYARAISEGREAWTIYPTRKKALYWKGAEHPVKVVHHPALKANPYVQEATTASLTEVVNIFASGVAAALNGNPAAMRNALLGAGLAVQANIMRRTPVRSGHLRRSWGPAQIV